MWFVNNIKQSFAKRECSTAKHGIEKDDCGSEEVVKSREGAMGEVASGCQDGLDSKKKVLTKKRGDRFLPVRESNLPISM